MELLESNQKQTQGIMDALLDLINDDEQAGKQNQVTLPTSVLIHLLICLSYLSKERFAESIEACSFVDRISQFVEQFSQR